MKILGVVLVVFGVLALVYGGIGYNKQHTVLEVGSIKATATEHKEMPVSPIVGGIALLAGAALLYTSRKQLA